MDHADYQDRARESAADRAEDRSFDEIISEVERRGVRLLQPEGETVIDSLTAVLRFAFDRAKPNDKELIREQLLDLGL